MNPLFMEPGFGGDSSDEPTLPILSRDAQLAELLSTHMSVSVRLCDASEIQEDEFLRRAASHPQTPQSEMRRHGLASIAVSLPEGSIATWDVDADQVIGACLHCRTILELETTQFNLPSLASVAEFTK